MLSHENRPYTDYEESIQLYSQHIEVCEPKNLTELIDLLDCQAKLAECCIKKTTPNYPLAQECCIKMGTGLEKAFLDVVEITNEEELPTYHRPVLHRRTLSAQTCPQGSSGCCPARTSPGVYLVGPVP